MKLLRANWLYRSWPWYLSGGLILVQFLPELWLLEWLILAAALVGLFFVSQKGRIPVSAALLVTIGAIWGSLWGGLTLDRALSDKLIKQDVVVSGIVTELPQQRSHALRFKFNIESLQLTDTAHAFKGPVILNWYDKPIPHLQAGDKWQMVVRLKPAHGSLNPGGFNYEKWLFSQGIRATGYVRETEKAHLLSPSGAKHAIDRFRNKVKQFIDTLALQKGGILSALSVGERSGISQQQWQVFRDTGTAHLIAISGLHIGLVAALFYFLAKLIWRHTLLVSTLFPAQHVARFAALIAAAIYAALAGFALPTVRAFSMLLAYFILQWLRRSPDTLFTLGFVLLVVLILDPLAPLSASLWLSFAAVAAIAYVATSAPSDNDLQPEELVPPGLLSIIGKRIFQWLKIQWAVFIGLLPLMLLFFQQFSIISLVANTFAIPLIGMLVVPLVLLAVLCVALGWSSAAGMLFERANDLLELIWPILESLSSLPIAIWLDASPPVWAVSLAMLGAFVLLAPKFAKYRIFGMLGFIPLFLPNSHSLESGEFAVDILDVGQGLAVLVQTEKHTLLYDAGIKYESGFDTGSTVVLPFMRQKGVKALDTAIASHQNIDHYGGLAAVLAVYPDAQRYSSAGFYAESLACIRGISWQWDGIDFRFLHPTGETQSSDNNDSCVLKISSPHGSILLTGDIEREAEADLLAHIDKKILRADVLLTPHHGSRSSSGEAFIERVNPRLAVISAGFLNRFKHPHETVSQRYLNYNINTLNTATSGAIQILFNESGIQAQPWRQKLERYWLAKFDGAVPIRLALNNP